MQLRSTPHKAIWLQRIGHARLRAMNSKASGSFAVTVTPQPAEDAVGDPSIGRMALFKQFQGDLVGSAHGQMLATRTPVPGSAAYVALDRVSGSLHGRQGSFSLQHSGTMNRGQAELRVEIVPDSGTEALTGIRGSLGIRIVDGQHFYDLDYSLPDPD
jgi:hypothetical protein